MAENVLSDAQMSMFQVVRPPGNFEAIYQGQAGTIPIAFPGTLDPQAGQPGFAAELLAGVALPLGSRVSIQIPMTIDMYTSEPNYAYQFLWRIRNQQTLHDAILAGRPAGPYHLPSEELGRNEIQGDPAATRFFIPAASDIEIFEQAEPVGVGPATLVLRPQLYIPEMANSWVQPLTPTGAHGVWQQGAYQFSNDVNCSGPTWFPVWLDAGGDELLILVYKLDTGVPWDFTGVDQGFSNTYGTNASGLPINPNIGILISSGTMGGG